jgi:hypothetical protein
MDLRVLISSTVAPSLAPSAPAVIAASVAEWRPRHPSRRERSSLRTPCDKAKGPTLVTTPRRKHLVLFIGPAALGARPGQTTTVDADKRCQVLEAVGAGRRPVLQVVPVPCAVQPQPHHDMQTRAPDSRTCHRSGGQPTRRVHESAGHRETGTTPSRAALVLRARREFDALVDTLHRDLFDAEASQGLLLWLVDVQPRAGQAWGELPHRAARRGPLPPVTRRRVRKPGPARNGAARTLYGHKTGTNDRRRLPLPSAQAKQRARSRRVLTGDRSGRSLIGRFGFESRCRLPRSTSSAACTSWAITRPRPPMSRRRRRASAASVSASS